ncbi:MAG: two component transcriptional regulator, winged helix family [Dehalococcoidia bacterium]|nr:two component transcriptional regulator, winged helix family [Dehalococcoidia bacterium]
MRNRILVVDDEEATTELICMLLEEEGYEVVTAADGEAGLRAFFSCQPALVVLDLIMPRMDGWNLLERIREVSQAPVIILSALGREFETIRGLYGGADDYIAKPFRNAELMARVKVALRKTGAPPRVEEQYRDSALLVDFPRHQVYLEGSKIDLTPQEFRLLTALIRNANMVMSTDQLLDLCWGSSEGGPENVRVYVSYLRRKLEDTRRPQLIETVREFGYCYRPPGG